ncbi:MAG TPA: tetratricopeptide repeat protein [Polyangiaceae bacterium]|nr:tetratricopeptide repeat protein [Polyangiaceae bacterium]
MRATADVAAPNESALEDLEPIVLRDPGDDDMRARYLKLADAAGEHLRAANALARAAGASERAVRERVWFDAATLYWQEAELPRARSAFLQAVLAGAGGPAGLSAAQRVIDLEPDPGDPDALGPALEFLARFAPDPTARQDAAARLLALDLTAPQEAPRLVNALRPLADSARIADAIGFLRGLQERDAERADAIGALALEPLEDDAPPLDRHAPLIRTVAAFRRDTADDAQGAVEAWKRLLQEEPGHHEAAEALLEAGTKAGGPADLLGLVAKAIPNLPPSERADLALRTARALASRGRKVAAVELCTKVLDDPGASLTTAQAIAEIAHDEDDPDLYRLALEHQVRVGSDEAKKRALERLGDFQFTQLKDARAAAESWRPAARMYEALPAERPRALSLYERVLDALPDDREAAMRLVSLYRATNDWTKLPEVLKVLVRTETATDSGSGAKLLLELEKGATEAGAIDEYVGLLDAVLERADAAAADQLRPLKKARARALGSDASKHAQASQVHRQLIDAFGQEEDVRDFEAFIESRGSAQERHLDRRFLYEWRARHDPRPARVLLEWARAEDEFGETDAAMAVYQRLADTEPGRREALEALCRIKLHAGDVEGGLVALRSLREAGSESERRAVILRMAKLLLEEMGRPAEAVIALAPLIGAVPAVAAANKLLQSTLADPATRPQVVERLEQLANEADPPTRLRVYEFLASAREETAAMPAARQRWFREIVELTGDRAAALGAAIDGVTEFPGAMELWDAAEPIARQTGQTEALARAYHQALVKGGPMEPAAAETLARRMVAFEASGADSPRLVEALQRTLELAPGARWALDRVKLVLGSQARWDELFRLYDRAIAAASDEKDRAGLLGEAAFAAKDLASLPERAIVYLESIHTIRPDDATVDAALERLYEKQGHTSALIELLDERLARATGFQRGELLRKLASLWLDLGSPEQAIGIIDRILGDGTAVSDVLDLLERVSAAPAPRGEAALTQHTGSEPVAAAQKRAIALLRAHYESTSRPDDLVRMAERELALSEGAEQRAQGIRELVRLRLVAAEGVVAASGGPSAEAPAGASEEAGEGAGDEGGRARSTGVFSIVVPQIEKDVAGDPSLAKIGFEALLNRALQAWKQPAPPVRDDAADGAWRTIHILKGLLVEGGKAEAALNLLYRCSRLPFAKERQRVLLRESAYVCADLLNDPVRAIRTFGELFEEDGGDPVAAASLSTFAALLEASGELQRLSTLWEAQAAVHARSGNGSEQRACWERAARLWERQEAVDKAVAAYGEAGALGSETAYEALARIHSERGAWSDASRALEWLVAHAAPAVRGLRALQLAEAYVALGDRLRARSCLESAIAAGVEAARADEVPERLITLYREDAAWQPLSRLLAAQARRPGHPERRLAWLREAADLHWRKLEEPAEAAALLELAVSWYPQDVALRPALADVLEATGQWDKTASVLKEQVALYRDQRSKERALAHHRLAHALEGAGKTDAALAELRTAAEMQPGHPGILYDLGRTALAAGQTDLAEGTYRTLLLALHTTDGQAEAGDVPPPHRAEVFVDLAEVAAKRGDAPRASDLVDSAVDAALESGEDPKRFEAPLAARGRHELHARAIERRVERAATLAARAQALSDLAALWAETLGRPAELGTRIGRHAERMGRELEHEGLADAAAWNALAAAHRAFGDETARLATMHRRASLLEASLPGVEAGEKRGRLRLELGRILIEEPGRADDALRLLQGSLDDAPGLAEAADLLAGALEKLERYDELVAVLERRRKADRAAGLAAAHETTDATLRLARALERSGRKGDAVAAYESVLDAVATDAGRLDALIERLAALHSERLADSLEKRLALGGEGSAALAQRLLDLRDRSGDAAGARTALELGFAADPGNAGFFKRLVAAYRQAGDEKATLRLLDPAIAARPDDAELLLLRAQAREGLGDDDGALFDLETAAVADERQIDALLALFQRILDRQAPLSAANGGRLPATSDVYAIRVVDVLLHAKRLDDAKRELERLLERSPSNPDALERIAAIHGAHGEWPQALDAYQKLLPLAEGGGRRELLVRVVLAMADVCEHAGDPGAARDWLEKALVQAPESQDLMQRLERVCEATGDTARLARLLAAHAERLEAPGERTRLFVRAGNLLLESARDPAAALAVAERARAADPDGLDAVVLWAGAMRQLGRPREAIAVLEEATAKARGKRTPLLARAHLEAGKAHLALDELVEAFDALKAGFAMDWKNAEIAMLLGLLAIDLDDDKLAERALTGISAAALRDGTTGADAAMHANAFYRLALMAQAKGDRGKAKRMASRALGIDGAHPPTRVLLDQLEPGGSPANRSGPRPAVTPRS